MQFSPSLEAWRYQRLPGYMSHPGAPYGAFKIPGPCARELVVMAADGSEPITQGWEHVSVSTSNRTPNWKEMCFIKKLFWRPEDCVVQFHPPETDYVNMHPFTLHLWCWTGGAFPMPPRIMV